MYCLRASLPCGQGPSVNSRGATQYGRGDKRTARWTNDQGRNHNNECISNESEWYCYDPAELYATVGGEA